MMLTLFIFFFFRKIFTCFFLKLFFVFLVIVAIFIYRKKIIKFIFYMENNFLYFCSVYVPYLIFLIRIFLIRIFFRIFFIRIFFSRISSPESEEISMSSIINLDIFFSLITYLHSSKDT